MSPPTEATLPITRRTRKSIGADVRRTRDKENATVDLGSTLGASRKKSRSKSLGPGGLDVLRQGSGNRRASLVAPAQTPRSILKPTVAPLPEIPPLKKKGRQTLSSEANTSSTQSDELNGSKIALRTEEEQHEAARQRAERDRRDARRKSLANRRVSFAAEATLHTFHEVDFQQDSTTSTDNSRRASNTGKSPATNVRPQEQMYDDPEPQPQRRSSGVGHASNSRDDDTATTFYSSDSELADEVEEEIVEEDEVNSSDSDDGTMMTVMTVDMTGTSMGSERTGVYDGEESSTLDQALRMAAQRAGNQRSGHNESNEDDSDEEVIPSFGWIKKGNQQTGGSQNQVLVPAPREEPTVQMEEEETEMDMEITNVVGKILKPRQASPSVQEEEISMDVTRVFGGIVGQKQASQDAQSDVEDDESPMEEATMEFTTAIGGIRKTQPERQEDSDDNEDMSMELTSIMGGVLGQKRKSLGPPRRRTMNRCTETEDATMDMTVGLGRIISKPGANHAEEDVDETMGMDMTTAIGGIILNSADNDEGDATMGMEMTTAVGGIFKNNSESTRNLSKRMMVEEVNKPNSPVKAIVAAVRQRSISPEKPSSPIKSSPFKETTTAADQRSISPGVSAFQGTGLRRSTAPRPSEPLIDFGPNSRTPSPNKPETPQPASGSPKKSAPSCQRVLRSASPRRLTAAVPAAVTPSPAKGGKTTPYLFQNNPKTGDRTPTIVLNTPQRKLTGVGADRTGLGSPRVAELFERRSSIGDAASEFVPGKRTVAFQDPQEMACEVDRERQREEDKENRRKILEREAEGLDATLNLREMIDSLSPKRNPLRGRKSLHVGSARGLLGKHTLESDDEEDEEEQDGVKRLKGHQGSPVKNVRLQQPPSKSETTGGRNLMEQFGKASTPSLSSPCKNDRPESPKRQARFKDVEDEPMTHEVFDEHPAKIAEQLAKEAEEGRIQLQDFLNMTSIRFMELNTTKRRHTAAPASFKNGIIDDDEDEVSLERCVITGACAVPTLELYQHSCRELKKYISEGRRIVKEIETDTFEENPPLFKEYMSATADVKALMDNQFKNVKTHARLLSKAMWYEWRMKLQEGLKEGLVKIRDGMKDDGELLKQQEDLLATVMPELVGRYEALLEESNNLEEVAQELADCDPADLEAARSELSGLDIDLAKKETMIAELREQLESSEADVETLMAKKKECISDITESEKIREECRGWTSAEIDIIKARVNAIEKEHGWAVTGISDTTLSMAYKREVELVFDMASFQPHQLYSNIDLWYIADNRDTKPLPKTVGREFFLQCIRNHIRALPQSRTPVSEMLRVVREGWDKAGAVSSQISRVNITFPTTVSKTSDSSVAITSSLLLGPLETRVETILNLHGRSGPEGIDIRIVPDARVVYGETFNVAKIGEFLATRVGENVGAGEEEWSDVLVELQQRLIARGKK